MRRKRLTLAESDALKACLDAARNDLLRAECWKREVVTQNLRLQQQLAGVEIVLRGAMSENRLRALAVYAQWGQRGIDPARGSGHGGIHPFKRWGVDPFPEDLILARMEEINKEW